MAALSSTVGPTLFDILKPTDVSVYAVSFFRNSIAIPRALSANARALLAKSVTFLIAFSARLRALLATCCPTSHAAFIPFVSRPSVPFTPAQNAPFPIFFAKFAALFTRVRGEGILNLLLIPYSLVTWLFPCTSSLSSTNNLRPEPPLLLLVLLLFFWDLLFLAFFLFFLVLLFFLAAFLAAFLALF